MWNFKCWKSALLLSIIIPIGLLTTFRITGILHEPVTISKTITADTIYWNISRPTFHGNIEENITNAYSDRTFSSSLTIDFLSYWENDGMLDYNDGLWLKLTATSKIDNGLIHSLNIKSSETDEYAVLDIINDDDYLELTNLTKRKSVDGSHSHGALFETACDNQIKECALMIKPVWMFFDANDRDHWITITLETINSDGTIYRQINIPIQLEVIA